MSLDPKKVVFNRRLSLAEAVNVYSILMETLREGGDEDTYYYVSVGEDTDLFIEGISSDEVYWMARKLSVEDKHAVTALIEYPAFWDGLKDHLYNCGINDYKRYQVFTKNDLMGEGTRVWEEYLGESEEDAYEFFSKVLMIEDIVSILEMEDEV